jgi:hypothetical protein
MSHHRPVIALVLISIMLGLGACGGTGQGSPTDAGTTSASAAAPEAAETAGGATRSAAASATITTTDPVPSDELREFTCELPIVEDPSVAIANITDVRVGGNDGYDRVVFEFAQGTPELTLDRASPPFTHDASGAPIEVEGASFLRLTMRGGTKQTDAGTSSYDGPTEFDPALTALVDLVEGGDFERQSTWYLGLAGESCVRLAMLDDPARLVIDVEH